MATTRTLTAPVAGPVTLTAHCGPFALDVETRADIQHAEVTISTPDDDGTAADLVRNAVLEAAGAALLLRIQDAEGRTVNAVTGGAVHGSVIQVGNVYGGVFIGGSNYGTIAGNVYGGMHGAPAGGVVSGVTPGQITITATLPIESRVTYHAAGASFHAGGPAPLVAVNVYTSGGSVDVAAARTVDVNTTGGSIVVGNAQTVRARTSGGNIDVRHVHYKADLHTSGGSITVYGADGAQVNAHTSGGDITHGGNLACTATTTGGRVRSVQAR